MRFIITLSAAFCAASLAAIAGAAAALPPSYGGTASSIAHDFGYCDGPAFAQPMPYLDVVIEGIGTVTTGAGGDWSIPGGGGPRLLHAELKGPYCWVRWNAAGPTALYEGIVVDGVPHAILFDGGNSQQDERDVFDAVSDVHDFFARFDPDFGYVNRQVQAEVGVAMSCGANWDGDMHFFREGGGCANTGELQSAVFFIYGRGVTDYILGWQGEEGVGEGNSDVLSNLMTDDPVVARGFILGDCGDGLRSSDNDLVYPDDVVGHDPYSAGSVLAGFHWDVLTALQDLYGQDAGTVLAASLWHFARVDYLPTNQPAQVLAVFLTDDDDGDLGNGTPHYDILCQAAQNHGFECPAINPTASGALPAPAGPRLRARPNPFNPETRLSFRLPEAGPVRLTVLDASGREAAVIHDGPLPAGEQSIAWKAVSLASGVYLARLRTASGSASLPLVLLK